MAQTNLSDLVAVRRPAEGDAPEECLLQEPDADRVAVAAALEPAPLPDSLMWRVAACLALPPFLPALRVPAGGLAVFAVPSAAPSVRFRVGIADADSWWVAPPTTNNEHVTVCNHATMRVMVAFNGLVVAELHNPTRAPVVVEATGGRGGLLGLGLGLGAEPKA